MITTNWTDTYDRLVWEAIVEGRVEGGLVGKPDQVIESGLAHIFFYGDVVYKLYKTYPDKDHFIKGVMAPTDRRQKFIEHDFALNQHFSGAVYRKLHSVYYDDGMVSVVSFDGSSIYTLVEMNRLDLDTNLHERLLRKDIDEESLFVLGYETARAVATCPIKVPESVNWYELASERVSFLRRFVDWLPEEFGQPLQESEIIEALLLHLEKYKEEYESLRDEQLSVNMDNHDENVFFVGGRPQFIDLLPPMSCWWYGLPYANLSNLMANIEALHSSEAALHVQRGYFEYHQIEELPAHAFGFTKAFAYLISVAHFGTVPEKREVTLRYLERLEEIKMWL